MDDELTRRLRSAAGPLPSIDDGIFAKVSGMVSPRPERPAFVVVVVGVLLAAVVGVGYFASNQPMRVTLEVAATDDSTESAPSGPDHRGVSPAEWQVLTVATTDVTGPSSVAESQEDLNAAWDSFDMPPGHAPHLRPDQGALLVSVAGRCMEGSDVEELELLRSLRPTGTFGTVVVDDECAVLDRFGSAEPGPRSLFVVGVPVEVARSMVGVEAVTTPLSDIAWSLHLVGADRTGEFPGAGALDQHEIEWVWENWNLTPEAPEIGDGYEAFVVRIPGTCDDPSALLSVEPMGYLYDDGFGTVLLTLHFNASCAVLHDPSRHEPNSVYTVAVPAGAAETLHGPRAFIWCRVGDDQGACGEVNAIEVHAVADGRLVAIDPW